MTPAQSSFVATVRARFGERSAITDPDAIAPWCVDWRKRFSGTAPAILAPVDTAQVAAIVALAAEARVPLVPQGGNTSMVGGATPPADGSALILSLRRMNAIRAIDAGARRVVAEAGVILADLHDAVEGDGLRFPLTLGARGSATVGGLVSTNAGGTQVLRFGTMRRLVEGVEAVLPDGSIHDGLSGLKKDNRGYPLDQLLIGAEGTLGIVTAAALRLVPAVARRAVAWAGLDSPEAALALLRSLESRTDMVESFEIVPADSLTLVLRHIPGTRAPLAGAHPWHVLIEAATGDAEADPAAMLEAALADALARDLVVDAALAASEAQAEAFWRLRESIAEAERAEGPAVQHDISVPVADMPRFMVEAAHAVEARFPDCHASGYGHLGDGNVHFHVRAPSGVEAAAWHAGTGKAASRFVHDLVTRAGGSISAEHGIGQMKRDELARLAPPGRIAALVAIKRALDPLGLFNPGKLVSLAPHRRAE